MALNKSKFLSYKEAWRRIKAASEQGYYFEVVTLCESIISDRLLSYVRGVNPSSKADTRTPFAELISEWRGTARTLPSHGQVNLGMAVNLWRVERNAVVHGITKSEPGTPTADIKPFIERAKAAAENGAALARSVSNWHKQQMRKKFALRPARSSND